MPTPLTEFGKNTGKAAVFALLTICSVPPALAQKAADGWVFTAAPYLWFTSLEGDVATISGIPPAEVDADFSDIWDNLNIAVMGYMEARKGRIGFAADLLYFDLTAEGDGPTNAFSGAEMDFKAFIGTFTPFYRVVEDKTSTVDLMAGGRVWVTDTDLTLKPGVLPGRSVGEKEAWVDPIIGLRGSHSLTDKLSIRAYGDVGGFGAASDITYQFLGTLSYSFSDSITGELGYRYLYIDYEDDGYILDASFSGPIAGVVFRF